MKRVLKPVVLPLLFAVLVPVSAVAADTPSSPPARGEHRKLDLDGDGKLSRDEAKAAPRMAERFDALDTDKDGFLTKDELMTHRGSRRKGRTLDSDGDGKVSREEAQTAPKLSAQFDSIDSNKDGFLTRDEMAAYRQAHGGKRGATPPAN